MGGEDRKSRPPPRRSPTPLPFAIAPRRPSTMPPPRRPSERPPSVATSPFSSTSAFRAPSAFFEPDPNAARGATNLVKRCLCVEPGETVHLLTFRAPAIAREIERAIEAAGATAVRVPIEGFAVQDGTVASYSAELATKLAGATASVLVAGDTLPNALSVAIAKTAETMRARHLHCLGLDERVLAQSARADPELLGVVNERLMQALAPPQTVRVTSDAGTDLELRLGLMHPMLASNGRPSRGASENLPAGLVYTHPARVNGVLVVDRAAMGQESAFDRTHLRRAPLRVTFASGRVVSFECADEATRASFDLFLESDANADRVGLVFFPTNYLVRSEIGLDLQDMLLPGVNLSLGFADASRTLAPHDAAVQLVLLGRRQTVEVGGRSVVEAGRVDQAMVEGIDPFR